MAPMLLGLAATLLVVLGHSWGLDRRSELAALDLRLRNIDPAPVNPDIVHVDIDDRSLEELGRWPWPREQLAGLVDVLMQCGARAVVLDIILPEPQETRYVSALTETHSTDLSRVIGSARPVPVFDDAVLAETLRRHPAICLPMHVDFAPEALSEVETRIAAVLSARPAASAAEVAEQLGGSADELMGPYRRAQKLVFGQRMDALVAAEPNISFPSALRKILPDLPTDTRKMESEILGKAYLRCRSLASLERLGLPVSVAVGYPARFGKVVPPLVSFAEAIHRTGFVTFQPDVDGVMRRIPLLARSGDRIFPQLALAVAAQELSARHGGPPQITADASSVQVRCSDGTTRIIPVDRDGMMLIRWVSPGTDEGAQHMPAVVVGNVWLQHKAFQRNANVRRAQCLELAKTLGGDQTRGLWHDLLDLDSRIGTVHQERVAEETSRQRALLFDPALAQPPRTDLAATEAELEAQLDRKCSEALEELDFMVQNLPALPAKGPQRAASQEDPQAREVRRALQLLRRIGAAGEELRHGLDNLRAEVRKHVEGKICLLGSTATGAADFVTTPVNLGGTHQEVRTPGVVVHANILNTILTGRFIRRCPIYVDFLAIALAGLVVTLLTGFLPVLKAGPLTVLAGLIYAGLNTLVVFGAWSYWLAMVAPLAGMLLSFLVVTAYRQLTEERAKRHIKAMFAHALSPALVDRLLADPSVARLGGERRVLTCFFSDLVGFTPLSQKLGEQQTVSLLNRYFDRMTEIVQNRCGGYLNKFLGDGIFVFFGAPVFQDDHPARAMRAALECQQETASLNAAIQQEYAGLIELSCRVGVATGEVMVGNCGSTQRMDYTAIGDTVNLASRLEGANKFFGTRILVADETWRRRDGDPFVARPLGRIYVVGRSDAEAVWNIQGAAQTTSQAVRQACADFAEAIELYQKRRFAEARLRFEAMLPVWPDDKATPFYADLCRQLQAAPPGDDWDDAIRLAEK